MRNSMLSKFAVVGLAALVAVVGALSGSIKSAVAAPTANYFHATVVRTSIERHGNVFTQLGDGVGTPVGNFACVAVIKSTGFRAAGPITITNTAGATVSFATEVTWDKDFTQGVGTYEVTGGTGAFEGATGDGVFAVYSTPDDGLTAQWEGTLVVAD